MTATSYHRWLVYCVQPSSFVLEFLCHQCALVPAISLTFRDSCWLDGCQKDSINLFIQPRSTQNFGCVNHASNCLKIKHVQNTFATALHKLSMSTFKLWNAPYWINYWLQRSVQFAGIISGKNIRNIRNWYIHTMCLIRIYISFYLIFLEMKGKLPIRSTIK